MSKAYSVSGVQMECYWCPYRHRNTADTRSTTNVFFCLQAWHQLPQSIGSALLVWTESWRLPINEEVSVRPQGCLSFAGDVSGRSEDVTANDLFERLAVTEHNDHTPIEADTRLAVPVGGQAQERAKRRQLVAKLFFILYFWMLFLQQSQNSSRKKYFFQAQ